jgi:hypothetical protein
MQKYDFLFCNQHLLDPNYWKIQTRHAVHGLP